MEYMESAPAKLETCPERLFFPFFPKCKNLIITLVGSDGKVGEYPILQVFYPPARGE
jgi:hypothetical protein